ncbi:hypothetical protein SESBI_48782 [Sesbania bispinosa]|nr:hypothetical protein SESBI_49437 [Sesbania bispinosa]KAJ1377560.1 hypothetical protein SESBI_48782 [Sesbania bispinosa]
MLKRGNRKKIRKNSGSDRGAASFEKSGAGRAATDKGKEKVVETSGVGRAATDKGKEKVVETKVGRPATSIIGPQSTAYGSIVEGSSVPDEIDLSQSQPPPLNPSPSKTHNMVLRPKLNNRGKGGNT